MGRRYVIEVSKGDFCEGPYPNTTISEIEHSDFTSYGLPTPTGEKTCPNRASYTWQCYFMEKEDMSTFKRKIIFATQILVALFTTLIWSSTPYYTEETRGLSGILFACIGARHMATIGRSWGWGLFAATGLGAMIILCLRPKPVLA